MIRKNLTLYILSMLMLLTSSGLAADWVDMGRVDFIVHLSDKDYEATKNDVNGILMPIVLPVMMIEALQLL